jgi:MarR family transcriptional regulator, lower aerobic nicotinate degradation pathway regulator
MVQPNTSSKKRGRGDAKGDDLLDALYRRPGFLIRRAHQIAVSIFLEESEDLGITTTQYGALVVLNTRHDLDQVGLATLVGIDRSTTALVVGKLESSGFLVREGDPRDKRRNVLVITDAGRAALASLAEPARRTRERELAMFSPEDQATFLRLLETFVDTFNANTRAPIKAQAMNDSAGYRRRRTPSDQTVSG